MPLFIISPILIFAFGFVIGLIVGSNDKKASKVKECSKVESNINDDEEYYNSGDFWAHASAMKHTDIELKDFSYVYRDKVYNVEVLYNKKEPKSSNIHDSRVVNAGGYYQEKLIPWIRVTSNEWSKSAELYEIDVNSAFNKFEVIIDEDKNKVVPEKVKNVCKIMFNKLYENFKDAEKERDINDFGRDGK